MHVSESVCTTHRQHPCSKNRNPYTTSTCKRQQWADLACWLSESACCLSASKATMEGSKPSSARTVGAAAHKHIAATKSLNMLRLLILAIQAVVAQATGTSEEEMNQMQKTLSWNCRPQSVASAPRIRVHLLHGTVALELTKKSISLTRCSRLKSHNVCSEKYFSFVLFRRKTSL